VSEINKALSELQQNLPQITKDLVGKVKTERAQYSYSYADLAQISRELLPLLGKHGLSFTARTAVAEGRFMVVYELRHVSGETIPGQWPLPERASPQEIGSAITYARRYGLCAVTGLAPDDEDHDAIVAEKAEQRRRRESRQPKEASAPKSRPMNADQQKRMQTLFEQLGKDTREARLAYAKKVLKRELRSATEMSHEEAEKVLAAAFAELPQKVAGGGEA
jgi:hypothetical protein